VHRAHRISRGWPDGGKRKRARLTNRLRAFTFHATTRLHRPRRIRGGDNRLSCVRGGSRVPEIHALVCEAMPPADDSVTSLYRLRRGHPAPAHSHSVHGGRYRAREHHLPGGYRQRHHRLSLRRPEGLSPTCPERLHGLPPGWSRRLRRALQSVITPANSIVTR
jgi:hypothetical protein